MGFWVAAAPYLAAAGGAILGGAMSNRNSRSQLDRQEALQREFAQYGIRWKTADAKAAGLHPLYALGASGASYSPATYSDALGPAVANAGAQVGNYFLGEEAKKRDAQSRRDALEAAHNDRQLQRDQIILGQQTLQSRINADNALAAYYLAQANAIRRQPDSGFPAQPETAQTGEYTVVPQKIPAARVDDPSQGAGPDRVGWMDVRLGNIPWLPEELQTLRVPWTDESWAEEFAEKIPVIAGANAARYYKWLSSDDIAAMYMSPYGRIKLINMARKKAPDMFNKLVRALQGKRSSPEIKALSRDAGLEYGP